jgi:TonB-linked SusC/RagA family outer membrane protein
MNTSLCYKLAVAMLLLVSIPPTSQATAMGAELPAEASGLASLQQQVGVIVGQVTDASSGAGVSNVSVYLVALGIGALTNEEGRFRLGRVPSGDHTIQLERIGYAALTQVVSVPAGGTATVNFAMQMETVRLDEIVVTASGEIARREVGNVIGSIDVPTLTEKLDFTDISQLLSGRTPGMQVIQGTGTLGSGALVRVRGINSMSLRNDPLVIIDGVRYHTGEMTATIGSLGSTALSQLNPNEIESIDVIKGPAAAALYGTAAANGVLVVKTRRGVVGPTQWSAYMTGGINQQPAEWPDNYQSWGRNVGQTNPVHCRLTLASAGTCMVDSLTTFNPLMNKETTPFASQPRFVYGLQARGGSGPITFFLSGEVTDDTGPYEMPASEQARIREVRGSPARDNQIHPNQMRQYSFRSNFDLEITPKARTRVSVGYNDLELDQPFGGGGGFFQGLLMQTLRGPGYRTARDGNAVQWTGDILSVEINTREKRFTGGLTTEYEPFPWLRLRGTGGIDNMTGFASTMQILGEGVVTGWGRIVGQQGGRYVRREQKTRYSLELGATATWDYSPDLDFRGSVGAQYFQDQMYRTWGDGFTLLPGASTITAASDRTVGEVTAEEATYGAYVEGGVNYLNRLFFTTGIRTDKNSAFGMRQGSVFYPRASVSWVVAEEPFFPFKDFFNDARLRFAWGMAGVQPSSTAAIAFYRSSLVPHLGSVFPGLSLGSLGNADLKPETTTEYEFGLDLGMLERRLNLEATYFYKKSEDALVSVALPPSVSAGTSQFQNLGEVKNTGLELAIDGAAVRTSLLSWDIRLSGTFVKNEIVSRGGVPPTMTQGARLVEGYPINGLWARPILGWDDANGDGILTENEVTVGDTMAYRGPQQVPPRQFILSNNFNFFDGQLLLLAQLDYNAGHFSQWNMERDRCGATMNCRAVNDPRTPLKEQAAAVAFSSSSLGRTPWGYMVPKDYIRLRELSLVAPIPARVVQALPIASASVTLAGRNLWLLWTEYPGLDPEAQYTFPASGSVMDYDWFSEPPIRTWSLRVNVNF